MSDGTGGGDAGPEDQPPREEPSGDPGEAGVGPTGAPPGPAKAAPGPAKAPSGPAKAARKTAGRAAKAAGPAKAAAARKAVTRKAGGAGGAKAPPAAKQSAKAAAGGPSAPAKSTAAGSARKRAPARKAAVTPLDQATTVPPPGGSVPAEASLPGPPAAVDDAPPPAPPPPPPAAPPPPPPPTQPAAPPPPGGGWPPPPPGGPPPPPPPPAWDPPAYGPAPSRGLDGLAVAALVLGIVSIPLFVLFVPAILAVVFGAISRRNVASNDNKTGAGMATAGLVLGVLSLIGAAVFVVATIASDDTYDDTIRYSRLQPGDCYEDPGLSAGEVTLESCTDEHDREAYAALDHPAPDGESFPGREALRRFADDECTDRFSAYVGGSYEESDLEVVFILPSSDAWEESDARRVVCAVSSPDGEPLIGSVRDSGT